MNFKYLLNTYMLVAIALLMPACGDDDEGTQPTPPQETVYVLGVGVTTPTETTNFVVATDDLMSGTISLEGQGILQEGYRDYAQGGNNFYSIGELGVNDVNVFTVDDSSELVIQDGLTFALANDQLVDVDGTGTTMIGTSMPGSPEEGLNALFYTVDVASNTITNRDEVPIDDVYDAERDWIFHTGLQVSGDQLYQTFYPVNANTFDTQNTDTAYVAIYSYPELALQEVIKDTRTGPAGAFGTRSGLFRTENGDLYTVSTTSFANGYSQSTQPAGILRIPAGTNAFDPDYFFNTDEAENGGKIAHAHYIGDGKLFATVTTQEPTIDDRWSDAFLQLAIVDLNAQTITPVSGAPSNFKGNGGRSFAAFLDDGKVYTSIANESGVVNIYATDVATATATKGAEVQGTFVGGLARLQ